MIDYFEALDFPCPMFKNPCDYYVDLVTHDYLTADASTESQERIRRLADTWQQKAPRLADVPADVAPPRVRRANFCVSLLCLYKRFWLLFFNHPWEYAREVFYALMLSILLGIIYFELSNDRRAGINDRFGLFYALLVIFLVPNLLVNIERVCSERLFVYPETKIRLYSKLSFLFVKVIFDFPLAVITYIIYAAPAYLLAGLQSIEHDQWPIFATYVAVIVLHGLVWRYISWLLAYTFHRRMAAVAILAIILGASALTCGVTLHRRNESTAVKWFDYISPGHWAMQTVASNEFYGNSASRSNEVQLFPSDRASSFIGNTTELVIDCERKRVLATKIADVPIYTVSQCSRITGRQAYSFAALGTSHVPINDVKLLYAFSSLLLGTWALIALACCFCCIFCNHKPYVRQRHRE
uniref:ABC-2 type transporter transmembrane domain-containing protein n=1 Tax=Plectus sambesii TaxID=2011161 RepID=A0A914WWK6_9BILA